MSGWRSKPRPPGGLDCAGLEAGRARDRRDRARSRSRCRPPGLNFRDMMWAMGLLPEEALIDGFAGPTFGLECAGIVRAVGPGVEDLAVGDRVAGFAPAALEHARDDRAHARHARSRTETSFAAAATIPVTFVTAIYALGTLAQAGGGRASF